MNCTLLQILKVYGTMRLCDLTRLIERDYDVVRQRVHRLRKNGYITTVSDREDTRTILLALTPEGINAALFMHTQ